MSNNVQGQNDAYIIVNYQIIAFEPPAEIPEIIFLEQPREMQGAVGSWVYAFCKIHGNPQYQWQYKYEGSDTWIDSVILGANTSLYTFQQQDVHNNISVRCKVTLNGVSAYSDTIINRVIV